MWNPNAPKAYVISVAQEYGLNADHFWKTINCESRFKASALGDDGNSRGIAQISDIYHPEVTDAEAYDPSYAVPWMAQQWASGHERQWSCYRILSSEGWPDLTSS